MAKKHMWVKEADNTFRGELFRRQLCRWCADCGSFYCLDIAHDVVLVFPDILEDLKCRPNHCPFPSCGLKLEVQYHRFHLCAEFPPRGWDQLHMQGIPRAAINRRLLARGEEQDIIESLSTLLASRRRPIHVMSFSQVYVNRIFCYSRPDNVIPQDQSCCVPTCARLFCLPEFHTECSRRAPDGKMKMLGMLADEYPNLCFFCLAQIPYTSDRLTHQCPETPIQYRFPSSYQLDIAPAYRAGSERRERVRHTQKKRNAVKERLIEHVRNRSLFCSCTNCQRVRNTPKSTPTATTVILENIEFDDIDVPLAQLMVQEAPRLPKHQKKKERQWFVQEKDPFLELFDAPCKKRSRRQRCATKGANLAMVKKRRTYVIEQRVDYSQNTLLQRSHASYTSYEE